MFCYIDDFQLTDGTISGGVALSQTRWTVNRVFDIFIALATSVPVGLDRTTRATSVDFQITRIHASIAAAELYALDHDLLVPSSGLVQFITTDGRIRYLLSAVLIRHERQPSPGATTIHNYHIEGGAVEVAGPFYVITEDSFYVLTETGGKIELET